MPRRAPAKGERKPFFAAWRDELPRIAAGLTTALILFVASLSFTPVRRWLFASDVAAYPLICTADPVSAPGGRRLVEYYIVNRSEENFTEERLQQILEDALRGSGGAGSAMIELPFDTGAGRIERVFADAAFNQDKGEVHVAHDGERVRIRIRWIHGGAILRVFLVVAGVEDVGPVSRDAKLAVPFDYRAMQQSCYTRR